MTTYGLTTTGFVPKTLQIVRDEINALLRAAFGASIKLHNKSGLGQIVGIFSEPIAQLWALGEAINSQQDPDKATGTGLEAVSVLTGTFRPAATYSTVNVVLTGVPTTPVPATNKIRTDSTDVEFQTNGDWTIAAVSAWVTATVYAVDDRVTNDGKVYQCVTAGTSAGTGPDTEEEVIDDGTAQWTFLGEGTGAVDAVAKATVTGPVQAFARDITTIVNQVVGWNGVINLTDANVGRDIATDSELRLLRELELAAAGSTPANALRAELLRVPDVVSATVFYNNTDETDADGVPPHSVEALVRGPETPDSDFDQSIFDALLAGVAAGVRTHGSVSGFATDDEGTEHVMKFSRPTSVPIYVVITVIKDADEYPADGDDQIKQAIVAWGDEQTTGKNAVSRRIGAAAFDVPGVLDVVTCYIGTAPGPASEATVPINLRELATYDTTRITVATSDGVP